MENNIMSLAITFCVIGISATSYLYAVSQKEAEIKSLKKTITNLLENPGARHSQKG
jgi:hypothetical protein